MSPLPDDHVAATTAILLAGGQGSRMNHQDKAWLAYQGKPLILHVLDRIKDTVQEIIISTNRTGPEYDNLPYPCIADNHPGFPGPLEGISSCIPEIRTPFTLVIPCDVPHLPVSLNRNLFDNIGDSDICVASDGERVQPLIFLARTCCLQDIRTYLDAGNRSVRGWLDGRNIAVAVFAGETGTFENINRPDQLR